MEPSSFENRLGNLSLAEDSKSSGTDDSKVKDDSEDRDRFMALVKKSRQLAENGDIVKALRLNRKALAIHHSEKLAKRIKKMEAFLDDQDNSSDDGVNNKEDMEDMGLGFKLHCSMAGKLYTHQKEGVLWLWTLFRKKKGGILADDMGLGKTIQVIAYLAGLFDMDEIKTVMIVVPLSVMPTWQTEFAKWTPGIQITNFHGDSKKEKEKALHRVRNRGGVILTTYGLVVTQHELLGKRHGKDYVWDYIILDEGHKIKNRTKTSQSMNTLPAKNRIILTGTPVQNNLKELWSLFDFVHQGSLLGTARTFKMQFETPITRARERDASAVEKRLGQEMSDALKTIIQPYFLRRTKKDVSQQREEMQDEKCAKMPELTRKNDIVLWVHLVEAQQKIYEDFTNLDEIKMLLMTKKSPLVALTVLKKICDHPRLLSTRACMKLGLNGDDFDEQDLEASFAAESASNQIDHVPDEVLVGESGKMGVLVDLLDSFKREGHKTLVFSQSRKLLNIIQKVITNRGHRVARLDGQVTNLEDRKDIVNKFQTNPSYSVFLLTVQVGGVGLTITAADRVIIYDPNWNPAVDAQAVDRAYRIGQTENVVVHRLITCGTVEEKIYRRQVFKDSITRQTTGNTKNPYRYFTKMELKELFTLDDPMSSKTQRQLQHMHENQRVTDESLDRHIAFLHSLDIFGISDHDLMFNQTSERDDEEEDEEKVRYLGPWENNNNEQFIQYKIQQAQMLIAEESSNVLTYDQRTKGTARFTIHKDRPFEGPTFTQGPPRSNLFTHMSSNSEERDVIDLSDQENDNAEDVEEIPAPPSPRVEPIFIDDSGEEDESKPEISHSNRSVMSPAVNIDAVKQEPLSDNDAALKSKVKHELSDGEDIKPIVKDEQQNISNVDFGVKIFEGIEEKDEVKRKAENDNNEQSDAIDCSDSDIEMTDDGEPLTSDSSSDMEKDEKNKKSISILSSHSEKSRLEMHKRALQPLTQGDVDKRSPTIGFMKDGSRIVSEELLISPDCSQPLITLTPNIKGKKAATAHISPSPSRAETSSSSRILQFSPLSNSPVTCSPSVKRKLDLTKTFFHAVSGSSTPLTEAQKSTTSSSTTTPATVLVVDSPTSSAVKNKSSSSSSLLSSLNSSGACRSLSFGMGNTTNDNDTQDKSLVDIIAESESDEDEESHCHQSKESLGKSLIAVPDDSDDGEEEDEEEVEEEVEEDEETNARFQELIMVARTLYKSKQYRESLYYVEEALKIFQEPDLEEMAKKIHSRIKQEEENS